MAFLTLIPLFGFTLAARRMASLAASTALLHTVAGSVLLLYLGGLAGVLRWAAILWMAAGTALLLVEGWRLVADRKVAPPPLPYGLLLVFILLFWMVHGDSQFFFYDEYSHWGVFLKDMLALDGFWGADTNSMHPRYPPGPPLWQYLFIAFRPPSDSLAYLAQFCLLVTPLMALFERLAWRQVGWILGITALCILLLANFGHGVASLYVDHVLGAWFAGILLCFATDENRDRPRVLLYALPICVLALIKDSGLYFALGAAGIVGLLWLRGRVRGGATVATALAPAALIVVILMVPAVIATQSWSWNRNHLDVPEDVMSASGIVAGIVSGTSPLDDQTQAEVSRRFKDVFFDQQLSKDKTSPKYNEFSYAIKDLFTDGFRLTTFWMFVLYLVWMPLLLGLLCRDEARWTWGIVGAGAMLSAAGYVGLLYSAYMFAFGEDALRIPSYLRYVHSAALPMLLVAFVPLLPNFRFGDPGPILKTGKDSAPVTALLFLGGLTTLFVVETPHLTPVIASNPPIPFRAQTQGWVEEVRATVGDDRVWIFFPVDQPNGFMGRILSFHFSPTPTTIERSEGFMDQSDQAILEAWRGQDYVWFPLESDALRAKVEGLIGGPQTSPLLRVSVGEDGDVVVTPVPTGG